MKPYALMVQTDADDRFFAESTIMEINTGIAVEYIQDITELSQLADTMGEPGVILINDSSMRPAGEQLRALKKDKEFGHIPIVVLGEMATREYIRKFYRDGANTYIIKPASVQATVKKISVFFTYWFEVAEIPNS